MNELYRWAFVVNDGLGRYVWEVNAHTLDDAQEAVRADCGTHVSMNQIGCRRLYGVANKQSTESRSA